MFGFDDTKSSSANREKAQSRHLAFIKIFTFWFQKKLATWQFKEGWKKTKQENIWMGKEKMRKWKRKTERKGKGNEESRDGSYRRA